MSDWLNITIFTVPHCPKCKILKDKLTAKGIEFIESGEIDEVIQAGFLEAPVLKVQGEYMRFAQANKWVNGR